MQIRFKNFTSFLKSLRTSHKMDPIILQFLRTGAYIKTATPIAQMVKYVRIFLNI